MKLSTDRRYSDPAKAARKLLDIANAIAPVDGTIYIEKINAPMLYQERATAAEYKARLDLAIRLAVAARRHLREVHAGRRRAIRLSASLTCLSRLTRGVMVLANESVQLAESIHSQNDQAGIQRGC
ncbi:hypothetical protein ACO2JO_04495 [Leptospira interrogans]